MSKRLRIVLIVIGALLVADTIFVKMRSNWNLGVALPALLGIPLLVYGVFAPRLEAVTRHGVGRVLKWAAVGVYAFVLAVIFIFSGMMAAAAREVPDAGADAVIVLGAGIRGDQVTYTLQNRLDAAAEYHSANPDAVIVVSGGLGTGEAYTEAHAMHKYLVEAGVPDAAIVQEGRSTSTSENFRFSRELLDERLEPGYHVVYVTNDFHILRAGINARAEGFVDAQGLAAPTPLYIVPNCYAREALALLFTYVFGPS